MKKKELKNRIQQLELELSNLNSSQLEFKLLEQNNKEKELKEAEERLHLVKETSGVGIWEWNIITNQIYWDTQMFQIYGLTPTPDGFVHYSVWSAAVVSEDIDEQEKKMQDSIKNIGSKKRSFKIVRANDGVCCHIEAMETIRTNAAGEPEWLIGTNIDVSERNMADQKLLESEQSFRNLVEKAPYPIGILKGADMVLDVANDQIYKIWNVGKEALGKPFLEIIPEMKDQPFMGWLLEVFHTGITRYGNEEAAYFIRENGEKELAYFNFVYQPYREGDGRISGVMILATDVTEQVLTRKKVEESEFRYHNMIYSSTSGIGILHGEDMTITVANDAIIELWGKGKEIIGKNHFDALPELEEQGYKEVLNAVYKTGKPFVATETPIHILQNGEMTLKYFNFILQPQHDIEGKIIGVGIIATEVTSQAEYNLQLKESEERFRSLADNVPLHIFIIEPDENATISYWNKNWLDYIGQTFEQAIGNTWVEVIHPDDVQEIMDIYLPSFQNRQPYFLPGIRVRRHDGEYHWHSVQANPRYLPNGEFIGYIGVGINIHESKLAQDALKASEEHFRKMADLMPAKISNANANGDVTYYNKNWLDFTGFTFEELRDFGYYQIMHPDEIEEFKSRFEKAAVTGTDLVMEIRIKNIDGDYVWHLNIASPVKDENGNIKMWVGVTTDISDQKKLREELEKSVTARTSQLLNVSTELEQKQQELFDTKEKLLNEYARGLIEAIPDPMFTISPIGKITDLNEASSKITGISREKLKGTNFINYFTEPEKALKGYKQIFEHGFVVDYPLHMKDENLTPVLFNGSVYKDATGNVIGAVVVARVITEIKRFEKELIEAKVAAESATMFKQQFLSNMSHEIRTPLNSILGFTNVLLKTELIENQKEFVQAIKTSGNSLNLLINDILDLAKVDAGRMTFDKQPFELRKSITSILHSFDLKIKEKNLKLVKEYGREIPAMLLGDLVRLNQIILNLMSNAIKFTHKGKITLSIQLLKEDEESAIIEFAVSDTGIGIAETKINSIFNVFEQAEISTSNSYGGTGLGLAIVKQLIEAQGGSISLRSKIGEGSTFSFILPFGKTKMKMEQETAIVKLDSEIKNLRVLVAEDVALNQLLIKIILNDFGFEYDVADNGKIAIEKLQNNTYDIILMDLQMPEMNGFETTEYIRKTMKSQIPIIALTADVTTVDISKCKKFGMDDYISKPINESLLYSKIVKLVLHKKDF